MDRPSIKFCAVCFCAVIILSLTACGPTEEQLQELVPVEKITVHWLAVDSGSDPTVAASEKTFVENFNKSQDEIELVLEIADAGYQGLQHLDDLIESGNPPDIIGPYGPVYANLFLDQLLDIEPLIGESFNLGDLDLVAVDAWRVEGRLIALPMGYWPAVIYYNKDLFDKAGLAYPPHQYNNDYAGGGGWTVEKIAEIGPFLTLDIKGHNAASPDFDINQAIQWGMETEGDLRAAATLFGAGRLLRENEEVKIPQSWREAARWIYSAVWEKKFFPNGKGFGMYGGDPFNEGAAAMMYVPTWYSCCNKQFNWDIAAVPAYNGKATSRLDHNGLSIFNQTEQPEVAARVIVAILSDPGILKATRVIPANLKNRDSFINAYYSRYPNVDWQVMLDSLNYPDNPSYTQFIPNSREVLFQLYSFGERIISNSSTKIDKELDFLEDDLQSIISK